MSADWQDLLWRPIHRAKAKMDYHSQHPMDLYFDAGEIIEVLGVENEDWWNGSIPNTQKLGTFKFGSFPKMFVEIVESSPEPKNDYQQRKIIDSKPSLPPRKKPLITSNNNNKPSYDDESDVLNEILNKLPELTKSKPSNSNHSSRYNDQSPSTISNDLESYEQFDLLQDPVSQCEAIIAEDFEGFFDASVVDFTIIDEYARETPESETATIKGLSYYLTSVWDHPLYKLRAIFTWITENITYDCESFYSGQYRNRANDAKSVLKSRLAVCAGYSELFYELSKASGLNVWKINGNAKGAGYEPGNDVFGSSDYAHAWNGVLYEGEYLLIDSTWGAGHVNNRQFSRSFNPFYFMCSPLKMIYCHLPTDPKNQYLKPTISPKEFLELPYYKGLCFKNGINFTKWPGCVAETSKDKISLEFEHTAVEEIGSYTANLNWKGQCILAVVQRLTYPSPNGGILYRILCNIPNNGDGCLNVYYYPRGEMQGPNIIIQKVINYGTGSNYKQFVKTYSTVFAHSIINPLEQTLEYNTKIRFEINVFGEHPAPKLLVFDKSYKTKQYLEIVDQNDEQDYATYAGDVVINCKGDWLLAYENEGSFSSIASYEVN